MTADTEHPLPYEWKQTAEYRRMVEKIGDARRAYIARLERERCQTADDERREVA